MLIDRRGFLSERAFCPEAAWKPSRLTPSQCHLISSSLYLLCAVLFYLPSLSLSSAHPPSTLPPPHLSLSPSFLPRIGQFCFCHKDAVVSIHVMTWFDSHPPFSPPPPPPSFHILPNFLPWYWVWCRQIGTGCIPVSQCFQTCLAFASSQLSSRLSHL